MGGFNLGVAALPNESDIQTWRSSGARRPLLTRPGSDRGASGPDNMSMLALSRGVKLQPPPTYNGYWWLQS